ncbi:hypothetical protein BESB_065100 [Besnoitia besnoiti]|uniref:Transmembrane protein n=1 Tax=Besnoitia besnoiti TaxID=94643 RepID=A0A2A9M9A4_BESBE|nr:hypothetical protein BESB_065100 [Besnoitia besnoiti]PFH34479.1 hypothetical protein BESB_065100 [Besnoitia besnoiti]
MRRLCRVRYLVRSLVLALAAALVLGSAASPHPGRSRDEELLVSRPSAADSVSSGGARNVRQDAHSRASYALRTFASPRVPSRTQKTERRRRREDQENEDSKRYGEHTPAEVSLEEPLEPEGDTLGDTNGPTHEDTQRTEPPPEDHVSITDVDVPVYPESRDYIAWPSNPYYGMYSLRREGKHLIYPSALPYVYEAVAPSWAVSGSPAASPTLSHAPKAAAGDASASVDGSLTPTRKCAFFLYVHPMAPTFVTSGDPKRVPGPNGGAYESTSTLWYWQLQELKRRGEHDAAVLFYPHFHPRMLSVGSPEARKRRGASDARALHHQGIREHAGWLAAQTRAVLRVLLGESQGPIGGAGNGQEAAGGGGQGRNGAAAAGRDGRKRAQEKSTGSGAEPNKAADDTSDYDEHLVRQVGLEDLRTKCDRWELFFQAWGTGGLSLRAMLSLGLMLWTNRDGWMVDVLRLHALLHRFGVAATVPQLSGGSRGHFQGEDNTTAGSSETPRRSLRPNPARREPDGRRSGRSTFAKRSLAGELGGAFGVPSSAAPGARRGRGARDEWREKVLRQEDDAEDGADAGKHLPSVHLKSISFIGVPHGGIGSRQERNHGLEKLGWTKWLMGVFPEVLLSRIGNTNYVRELLHVDNDLVVCSLAQEEKQNYNLVEREGSLLSFFDTVLFYAFLNAEFDVPTLSQLGVSEDVVLTSEAAEILRSNPAAQNRFFYVDPFQTALNKLDIMTSPRFASLIVDRRACTAVSAAHIYNFVLRVLEVVNGQQRPKSLIPNRYLAFRGDHFYDARDDANSWTYLVRQKSKHENAGASRFVYMHQAVRLLQGRDAQEVSFDDDRHSEICNSWFYRTS